MAKIKILWIDDEVDLLKPHMIFLQKRGYETFSCNNGNDALDFINEQSFDVIILDENMPGLSGIETLELIKAHTPNLPVIMVTKSEEEEIMEEAIGSKISDYLIKPVNPNQILLSLKKIFQHNELVTDKILNNYQKEFSKISLEILNLKSYKEWMSFYRKLVFWELELDSSMDSSMMEIFKSQFNEANHLFSKFVSENYLSWILKNDDSPILSHDLFKEKIKPIINNSSPTMLLVIDNLRLDQWKIIEPLITPLFSTCEESLYFSILPTATQYSRNSIFSGLNPFQMSKIYPKWWKNDNEDGGKNLFENEFLKSQLNRLNIKGNYSYHKITNLKSGKHLASKLNNHSNEILTCIVYNFVDMISHAKSEMEIIKELASDNKAYRSLTLSWFKNSPLFEIIKKSQLYNYKLIITTDHGTVNVNKPVEVIGDKETSLNLRYKTGKSLKYSKKNVFEMNDPEKFGLPKLSMNHNYIFSKGSGYFIYPKNFNYFAKMYEDSFQHGGISMEEMILPFIVLDPKK